MLEILIVRFVLHNYYIINDIHYLDDLPIRMVLYGTFWSTCGRRSSSNLYYRCRYKGAHPDGNRPAGPLPSRKGMNGAPHVDSGRIPPADGRSEIKGER